MQEKLKKTSFENFSIFPSWFPVLIIDQKNIFKKVSILWPFTFYSDPALFHFNSIKKENSIHSCKFRKHFNLL